VQKVFIVALVAVIILATGFCVIIITSLIPYFSFIGKMAVVVVGVLLACISLLIMSFTWSRMGVWGNRRRLLVAGDVVAFLTTKGEIVHLSAQHEAAKVPLPGVTVKEIAAPKEQQPTSDKETVLELFDRGISLRNICDSTGLTYYQVQKITSGK